MTSRRTEASHYPGGEIAREQDVGHVIAPVSVDMQIFLTKAFLAIAHLLGNRTRGGVFRANVQLHSVQAEHVEGVIGRHRHTHRGDAPTGELLIDPIPDVGAAQRAIRDSAHRYLPHQSAAKLGCPRQHATFARFGPKPPRHRVETRRNLSGTNSFRIADAAALPFDDATFDLGWSQNVSMNVADKTAFYRNIYRVLRPGGRFVTSDVVTGVGGEPAWPLPWARDPSISFVSTPHEMRSSMEEVGFRITAWLDTTSNAVSVFQNPNQQARRGKLGVGLIAGPDFGERSGNLARGMADGIFASVLVRAEKD